MYLKPGTQGKDKFDVRWEPGIWLGARDESAESIMGTKSGCIRVKDIRRFGDIEEHGMSLNLMNSKAYHGNQSRDEEQPT